MISAVAGATPFAPLTLYPYASTPAARAPVTSTCATDTVQISDAARAAAKAERERTESVSELRQDARAGDPQALALLAKKAPST